MNILLKADAITSQHNLKGLRHLNDLIESNVHHLALNQALKAVFMLSSNGCKTVTDVGERKQILKRSGRCFICLKKYHISKECRSTTRCQKCEVIPGHKVVLLQCKTELLHHKRATPLNHSHTSTHKQIRSRQLQQEPCMLVIPLECCFRRQGYKCATL